LTVVFISGLNGLIILFCPLLDGFVELMSFFLEAYMSIVICSHFWILAADVSEMLRICLSRKNQVRFFSPWRKQLQKIVEIGLFGFL